MNTYKNRIASPFQVRTIKKDPLEEEARKNVGAFNLTLVVEKDTQTEDSFRHIPGFIAYLCTLKKDSEILSIGRGSVIINKWNKWVEKGIRSAFTGAVVDAVVRATRTLDALYLKANDRSNPGYVNEETNEIDYTPELASERQKAYLKQLIGVNVQDEEERNQCWSELDQLTKDEASEKIQFFKQ